MISISENHNMIEWFNPYYYHPQVATKRVTEKQHLAQLKINELPLIPLNRPLYVNMQGQQIGSIINDIA